MLFEERRKGSMLIWEVVVGQWILISLYAFEDGWMDEWVSIYLPLLAS